MAELNLTELREVAEAAYAEDWQREWWDAHASTWMLKIGGVPEVSAFFGEADPPTVLALLDRVAELEAVVGRAFEYEWAARADDPVWISDPLSEEAARSLGRGDLWVTLRREVRRGPWEEVSDE